MIGLPDTFFRRHIETMLGAAGSADHTVRLWGSKLEDGQESSKEAPNVSLLKTFTTKATPVFHVSFTPRNLLLASGAMTLRR